MTPRTLAALVLFSGLGCGMQEYEIRMDAQRARVSEFDDSNRTLDDPIDMTILKKADAKEEPLWRFEFFLRLPKGYGTTPKEKTPYRDPFPCYRFANNDEGHSILVIANLVAETKAKEKIGEYSTANFRIHARLAIAEYYAKNHKAELKLPEKTKPQERIIPAFSAYPESAAKLKYEFVSYAEPGNKQALTPTQFDVYLHEAAGKQVCIIVQHPARLPNADAFNKSIEACLSTLDVSSEGTRKRAQFKRSR